MKKHLFPHVAYSLAALYLFPFSVSAQDLAGIRTSDYPGVNGVFFNPAGMAGSSYRFDVNMVALHPYVDNNKVAYRLGALTNTFESDSIENMIFGTTGGFTSGAVNVDIHGPSFMFNTSAKAAFALTTRLRYMTNVKDMDGKLLESLSQDAENNADLPYTISSSGNMRVNAHTWSELGASMAHIFIDSHGNILKGGVTLKYLIGTAETYIGIDKLSGTLNTSSDGPDDQKVYLQNASGHLSIGTAGVDIGDIQVNQLLKPNGRGLGADIGLIYEYRPQTALYDSTGFNDLNASQYKIKVSLSLLDLGRLAYHSRVQSGDYDIHITGDEKLDMEELEDLNLHDYKTFFDQRPEYFTPSKSEATNAYKIALPSTLLASVDYRVLKGLCLNLEGRIALMGRHSDPFNNYYYSSFIFTPRFEGPKFAAFLPVSYSELTHVNAGFAVRAGPLFLGSGSLLTALINNSKQADIFFGIHVFSLRKNRNK